MQTTSKSNDVACKYPVEKGWPSCCGSLLPSFKWDSLTLVVVCPHEQRCHGRTAALALRCFCYHWYHDSTTEWLFHPCSSEDKLQDGSVSSTPGQDFSNQLWRTAFPAVYHKTQFYCSHKALCQFSRRHQPFTKPSPWNYTGFSSIQAVQLLRQTWHKNPID